MTGNEVKRRPRVALVMLKDVAEEQFGPAELARLRSVADVEDVAPLEELSSAAARARLADTDALVTSWGSPRLDAALLGCAPRLRAVFHSAGSVRSIVSDELWRRGILVTNAADENAEPVAEFVVATITLASKRVPFLWLQARNDREDWSYRHAHGELGNDEGTVGLVGFSRVGRRVAQRLRCSRWETLVYDPIAEPDEVARTGARSVTLDELLRRSDVVSLHAPELPSTDRMIGAAELGRLRDGATILNTARGTLIDTDALAAECGTGRLYAILDVTEPEPLPASSLLYGLPNVVITPHVAGSLGPQTRRMSARALTELERFAAGLPPEQPVSPDSIMFSA